MAFMALLMSFGSGAEPLVAAVMIQSYRACSGSGKDRRLM